MNGVHYERKGGVLRITLVSDEDIPDIRLDELLLMAADPRVDTVSVVSRRLEGDQQVLEDILNGLKRMAKNVELTVPAIPSSQIENTQEMAQSFILECNDGLPLSELLEDTDFHRTLGLLIGRPVTIRRCIGHTEPDEDQMRRLGEAVASVARIAVLHQCAIGPDGKDGHDQVDSLVSEDRMIHLGRIMARYVPRVILRGSGFRVELSNLG